MRRENVVCVNVMIGDGNFNGNLMRGMCRGRGLKDVAMVGYVMLH